MGFRLSPWAFHTSMFTLYGRHRAPVTLEAHEPRPKAHRWTATEASPRAARPAPRRPATSWGALRHGDIPWRWGYHEDLSCNGCMKYIVIYIYIYSIYILFIYIYIIHIYILNINIYIYILNINVYIYIKYKYIY